MSLHENVAACFREHPALLDAAKNARIGLDMLCVALRDGRATPYPTREQILARLEMLADILNAVAPRSPLRTDDAIDCPECGKSRAPAGDGSDAYNCACPDPLIAEAIYASRS